MKKSTIIGMTTIAAFVLGSKAMADEVQGQPVEELQTEQVTTEAQHVTVNEVVEQGNQVGTVDTINVTPTKENEEFNTYDSVQGKVEFHVDEQVKAGDYTEIQIPEQIKLDRIPKQPIELETENAEKFATAEFTPEKIVVRYNNVAENLQNIKGGFNFYYKLNHDLVKQAGDQQLVFTVNNKQKFNYTLHVTGYGKKNDPNFEKSSWQNGTDGSLINTVISIGKKGTGFDNVEIYDDIDENSEDNAIYDYSSFEAFTGTWSWSDMYGWEWKPIKKINDDIVWLAKNSGDFRIKIPEQYNGQQLRIVYNLKYTKPVETDETVNNRAHLFNGESKVTDWPSYASIYNLSGWINGNNVVQEVPNTFPTIEKPEIPLVFEVPNTYPTVEKPEIPLVFETPNTFPTIEKPELPFSMVPNTFPTYDLPSLTIKPEPTVPEEPENPQKPSDGHREHPGNSEYNFTSKQENTSEPKPGPQTTLPSTGDNNSTFLTIVGWLLFGFFGLLVGLGNNKNNKK